MDFLFEEKINSDIYEAYSAVNKLLSLLESEIDGNLIYDIRIILNELLINGIKHGNCCCRHMYIRFKVYIIADNIFIEVEDEGEGIEKLSDCLNSKDDLKCSGRGLKIVKELSESLAVNKNKVTVKISKKYGR